MRIAVAEEEIDQRRLDEVADVSCHVWPPERTEKPNDAWNRRAVVVFVLRGRQYPHRLAHVLLMNPSDRMTTVKDPVEAGHVQAAGRADLESVHPGRLESARSHDSHTERLVPHEVRVLAEFGLQETGAESSLEWLGKA